MNRSDLKILFLKAPTATYTTFHKKQIFVTYHHIYSHIRGQMDFVICTRESHEQVDVIPRLMKVQGSLHETMKNDVQTN